MKIKCGHTEFDLGSNDVIMYNGACYQIITQEYTKGWGRFTPSIAKAKAKKMIRDGLLVVIKETDRLTYYKLKEAGE